MGSQSVSKSDLRQTLRLKRNALSESDRQTLSQRVCENARGLLESNPGVWASYCPFGSEVDPQSLEKSLAEDQHLAMRWVFPRVEGQRLQFHFGTRPEDFEAGYRGISEPKRETKKLEENDLIGVLVPGLGFDSNGARLGSGQGFYDRFLETFKGISVGLAFECQVTQKIPVESFDSPVDFVVTEKRVMSVRE